MVGHHGGMQGLLNPNGHLGFVPSSHLVEWEPSALGSGCETSKLVPRIDLSRFETIGF